MEYTQKGGLKKLLKLRKDDIAKMLLAELNRLKPPLNSTTQSTPKTDFNVENKLPLNSTLQSTSKVDFNVENNVLNQNDVRNRYYQSSANLFDTFEKIPTATNNKFDATLTNNTVISVSPTMVVHKSDLVKEIPDIFPEETVSSNNKYDQILPAEKCVLSKEIIDKIDQLIRETHENKDKIHQLELKNASLDQYSRRNNVEIGGIPENIGDDILEGVVIDILQQLNKSRLTQTLSY